MLHTSTTKSSQLVDGISGTLDIVADPLPFKVPHILMNKFSGPEDRNFNYVVDKVNDFLRSIRMNTLLEKADAELRNGYIKTNRLMIERISGDVLPMQLCYINL